MTFHELAGLYLSQPMSTSTLTRYMQIYKLHFQPWDDFPTFQHIERWQQSMAGSPHTGNKGINLLKAIFTWGQRRGHWDSMNPASGIKRHRVFSRARVMSPQEIGDVLRACAQTKHKKLAAMLIVLLTTGCRLSEACMMKREHVDMKTGEWFQPITKNGKPHTTYLPLQARLALVAGWKDGEYFFKGIYGHHWSRAGVEKCWRQLREAMSAPTPTRDQQEVKDIRLHDFRRTLATYLYKETKDDYLVKRCINHVNTTTTGIYIRVTDDDVAKALQAQADRFFALAKEQPVMEQPRQLKSWSQAVLTA